MDGRVSDFDDIFILLMKMEMESSSRLGSKTNKKNYGGRSFHVSPNKYKHCWNLIFFMTKHVVVLLSMDLQSSKSDVNGQKTKIRFFLLWIRK